MAARCLIEPAMNGTSKRFRRTLRYCTMLDSSKKEQHNSILRYIQMVVADFYPIVTSKEPVLLAERMGLEAISATPVVQPTNPLN